ncbi:hypothetical protein chiPu_0025474, partial [Chiloscyllium punctatum]|nr:hypothetical protein [Chiloscyllium punctatum]
MSPDQRRQVSQNALAEVEAAKTKVKAYTLEEFSYDHFRPPAKESMNRMVLARAHGKDRMWACSREPLRQPLLKKVCANADMVVLACHAFTDILSVCHQETLRPKGRQLLFQAEIGNIEYL